MNDILNHALTELRETSVDSNRLHHLESDVWARIVACRQDEPAGWLERILAFLFPAQHRLVPIMGAVVLGVTVAMTFLQGSAPATDAAEMLNFKVFTSDVSVLASLTDTRGRL